MKGYSRKSFVKASKIKENDIHIIVKTKRINQKIKRVVRDKIINVPCINILFSYSKFKYSSYNRNISRTITRSIQNPHKKAKFSSIEFKRYS